MGPLIFLRLKSGYGGEASRVVHLSEAGPDGKPVPAQNGVRTLCGYFLQSGTFDVLSGLAGMPCEPCALNTPTPEVPQQLAAG